MKFYYFHLMPYIMDHDEPSSWVSPSNRHYDPGAGHTLYNRISTSSSTPSGSAGTVSASTSTTRTATARCRAPT